MTSETPAELLAKIAEGNALAFDQLFGLVYADLRQIARHHLVGNLLAQDFSSTDLVHEAYSRLIDAKHQNWKNRTHFLSLGSKVMRQVLVDRARHNAAHKRGGQAYRVDIDTEQLSLDDDAHVVRVDEALQRLAAIDAVQARIVELRFFGGLTVDEVALQLRKSKRWVEAEWTMIRAWLRSELSDS